MDFENVLWGCVNIDGCDNVLDAFHGYTVCHSPLWTYNMQNLQKNQRTDHILFGDSTSCVVMLRMYILIMEQ